MIGTFAHRHPLPKPDWNSIRASLEGGFEICGGVTFGMLDLPFCATLTNYTEDFILWCVGDEEPGNLGP
jgi:hypothetical protein